MRNPFVPVVMLLLLAVFLWAMWPALPRAFADEYNAGGTVAQGQNIQTLVVGFGVKVCLTCPNLDGGTGQKVFYRPGGCTTCVIDAGPGDNLIDFTQATDCYPITMRYSSTTSGTRMDRLHLRGLNATDVIYCSAPQVSP